MHKYERFIIYPLLILALFYGMAGDQVMTSAQKVYDEIVAKNISIVNEQGERILLIGNDVNGSGSIDLYDNEGDKLIGLGSSSNEGMSGLVTVYNKYHNKVIYLTQTLPNEERKGGYHGIIAVLDRYGENPATYGHSSY